MLLLQVTPFIIPPIVPVHIYILAHSNESKLLAIEIPHKADMPMQNLICIHLLSILFEYTVMNGKVL